MCIHRQSILQMQALQWASRLLCYTILLSAHISKVSTLQRWSNTFHALPLRTRSPNVLWIFHKATLGDKHIWLGRPSSAIGVAQQVDLASIDGMKKRSVHSPGCSQFIPARNEGYQSHLKTEQSTGNDQIKPPSAWRCSNLTMQASMLYWEEWTI